MKIVWHADFYLQRLERSGVSLDITTIVERQRAFFATGATKELAYRLDVLRVLRQEILKREEEIAAALREDLGKSAFEGYMTETCLLYTSGSNIC